MSSIQSSSVSSFELRFVSLTNPGRGFSFPCDAGGNVDMDALSERARSSYLGARAPIGHDLAHPPGQPPQD